MLLKRRWEALFLSGAWAYLVAGGLVFRLGYEEDFSTLSQAVYFTMITCTTVGYGDMSPTTTGSRMFVIAYSVVGIMVMAQFLGYFGGILSTACERPASWFLHHVAVRLCPGAFHGYSAKIWNAHHRSAAAQGGQGGGQGAYPQGTATAWLGALGPELASEPALLKVLGRHGEVLNVTVAPMARGSRVTWALATFRVPAAAAAPPGGEDPVGEAVAAAAEAGTHTVLEGSPLVIARHALASESGQSLMTTTLAVVSWLTVLLVFGPLYGMNAHDWTWEESFYFTYITMCSIGYGDFYPMDGGALYSLQVCDGPAGCGFFDEDGAAVDARDATGEEQCKSNIGGAADSCNYDSGSPTPEHHQVFVWCMGALALLTALSTFGFVVNAAGDLVQERRELKILLQQEAEEEEKVEKAKAKAAKELLEKKKKQKSDMTKTPEEEPAAVPPTTPPGRPPPAPNYTNP
eukprot:SAG22_NODE_2599_length_2400_cov_2.165146_1_plen_461_part_00